MVKHLSFLFLLIFFSTALVAQEVGDPRTYAKTITAGDLEKHLQVIASDEYEGRETGKEGQKKTAKYLADQFKAAGIPAYNGSYYQPYTLNKISADKIDLSIGGKNYTFLEDFFLVRGLQDTSMQLNEVVFKGYGIEGENIVYTDYAENGLNIESKAVLILSGEPMSSRGTSVITGKEKLSGWANSSRGKVAIAKEKGATVIFVEVAGITDRIQMLKHFVAEPYLELPDEKREGPYVPIVYISTEMADAMLEGVKKKTAKLKKKMGKKKETQNYRLNTAVDLSIKRKVEKVETENVVGYIEGTDKKEEVVVLTAHYDHLGVKDGEVYNGADDDGSGTVTLIEIAEAFAKAKAAGYGPRRSILILPVSGEEKGLLGSKHYVRHPLFPLEQTVADLNIDMIGRTDKHHDNPDYVYIIGSDRLSSGLHKISEEANGTYLNLKLDYTYNAKDDPNRFYYRSDHYSFAKNKVPVIFYFSGVHEDYHKPTDTIEKIDFDKIEKTAHLVFYTAWLLANQENRVVVDIPQEE